MRRTVNLMLSFVILRSILVNAKARVGGLIFRLNSSRVRSLNGEILKENLFLPLSLT